MFFISVNPRVSFAISSSATWIPGEVLDCPGGYHWASTSEAYVLFPTVPPAIKAEAMSYYGQCGWTGYSYNGVDRKYFRFSDSHITGAIKSAGDGESVGPLVNVYSTSNFAGIVCVAGEAPPCVPTVDNPCLHRAGVELWSSDGTVENTKRVADILPGVEASNPSYLTILGSYLYFSASDVTFGAELWRSDGTATGTVLVQDLLPGMFSSNPKYIVTWNGALYFAAVSNYLGEELWFSNGVVGGSGTDSFVVLDICNGPCSSSPQNLAVSGGNLYFSANDGMHGRELWVSTDGTAAGTRMVADINSGPGSSNPSFLVDYNGILYFSADNGVLGSELWRSDGTALGTYLVLDITLGQAGSNPSYLTVFAPSAGPLYPYGRDTITPTLIFIAETNTAPGLNLSVNGGSCKLWVSDGTTTGTRRAFTATDSDFDIDPDTLAHSYPPQLGQYGGSIYLSVNKGNADELIPAGPIFAGELDGVSQSIVVSDVDAGNELLTFTLSATKGVISLSDTTGLTLLVGTGIRDSAITFMSTLEAANAAFRQVRYDAASTESGEDKIDISVNDNGASGYYGMQPLVSTSSIDIWITAVNRPPVITISTPTFHVPAPGGVVLIDGISVSDPDINMFSILDGNGQSRGGLLTVRISSSMGTGSISLVDLTGLAFTVGSGINDVGTVEFTGLLSDVNEAIRTIRYTAGTISGTDVLTIYANDNGYSGKSAHSSLSDSATVHIIIA